MTTPRAGTKTLQGKVAIVTGWGRGIGREYALAFAREGAKVVVAEVIDDNGHKVAEEVQELGGEATFLHLDLAEERSCQEVAAQAARRYGGIDILANNGAIYHSMRRDSFMNVSLDYFNRLMAVNVTGQMLMTRAVAPAMKQRGRGKIVFQASAAAYSAISSPYGLSKLAVVGLTKGFAAELGPYGINVNCIAPGPTDTEATRTTVSPQQLEALVKTMPLGRIGQPKDMVGAMLFLASEASDFMTGQVLLVDGGLTRGRL